MPRTRPIASRWTVTLTLAAALFVVSATARPSAAAAQSASSGIGSNWCELGCVALGLTILALPTTMLIAQAAYAGDSRWFPTGWAIGELTLGLPMLALGVAGLSQGESAAFGAVFGGLGLWFTTHAIISLIVGDDGGGGDRAPARVARLLGPVRFDL